jgi:pimeloyl-ACP methyl ester carboxylesterase
MPPIPAGPARPPIICIPGLTRNARDWEGVAARLAGQWRVICVDLRGRGESAYAKDPMTYVPLTYLQDLEALLRELQLDRFILFGTSLGGLLSMLLCAAETPRVAAVLINDIGPEIDQEGIARIRTYVGRMGNWPTWVHAARDMSDTHGHCFPDWQLDDWLVYAKRVAKLSNSGASCSTMTCASPSRSRSPRRWPAWTCGARSHAEEHPGGRDPGETSDILSPATLTRMEQEHGSLDAVTIPRTGHAPTLDEPEARAAIDRLLARAA